ncbi:autotransporter domain-containing protein [Cedecea colo]|uniref:Autotransporter domain-containing protein n=1 Tax=Cedecea colo TaxID=2552946 RepID=A0ABX0VP93_9ENTR|nr:autotransporter domain-containing protein [Cedecea colo]NIY48890.1 autotransporter domain-containing protein [Cedecea colo]
MIKNSIRSGHRVTFITALTSWCLLHATHAFAWQQEYIAEGPTGDARDRYTWDSERAPGYNEILAERIYLSMTPQSQAGLNYSVGNDSTSRDNSRLGIGWTFPVMGNITTGPTAEYSWDGSSTGIYNEYGDSVVASRFNDRLWHASVSTVGWRLDSTMDFIRPWAQVSYNHQYGDNIWKAQSGSRPLAASVQDTSWMDVTVGADVPIGKNVAAFASMSQAEGAATGEAYMYNLGVNARF